MGFATKKKFFALTLASTLIAGYAGSASSMQAMDPNGPTAPPSNAPSVGSSYFSKHFSTDALSIDVKNAVLQANLAPVSFKRITVHTRDQVTARGEGTGQPNQATYTVTIEMEDGGHGLVRQTQSAQSRDGNTIVRFELSYRGYFPFLTQSVPANADSLPPVIEARKVMHFDTHTDGHINFTYLYGPSGKPTFADPGQVICDSGKSYSASELNPAIQGQALELNCQNVDTNGMTTSKIKLAYLENYGVALMVHTQNPESSLDSTIVDFTAE
ncbi:hypothetical protein [Dyella flava]|nr:hypothetical protein [Dyella flava]